MLDDLDLSLSQHWHLDFFAFRALTSQLDRSLTKYLSTASEILRTIVISLLLRAVSLSRRSIHAWKSSMPRKKSARSRVGQIDIVRKIYEYTKSKPEYG